MKHPFSKTLIVAAITFSLLGCASNPMASKSVEEQVYFKYEKALNNGNLDAIMELVTDDVAFNNPGRCKPNPCRGASVLREFIKETVMDVRGQLKTLDVKSKPGEVDARVEFTSEKVRASGIERILGNERWKITQGKISLFEFAIEKEDKQSMAYIGSLQHAAAQEAARRANQPKP
jgi:SnoaL-like domain